MIGLNAIELLLKEQSLFSSLITAKVYFQLLINNQHSFKSQQIPIKSRFAKWKSYDLSKQIPLPHSNQSRYEIQLIFHKGSSIIGRAKSVIAVGHNRKDCLDVIDDSYIPIGKCTYQISWESKNQQDSFQKLPNIYANQNYMKNPQNPPKQYVKIPPNHPGTFTRPTKPPKKKQGIMDSFIGCFGCTSNRARKPINVRLTNIPLVYTQQQIQYAPPSNLDPIPIQYFSKRFHMHNNSY